VGEFRVNGAATDLFSPTDSAEEPVSRQAYFVNVVSCLNIITPGRLMMGFLMYLQMSRRNPPRSLLHSR
jgi:hypothetical protein